jgi:hypothetical protein
MAATSRDGRECAGRDANLLVLHRAFDQRNGLVHRVHLDRCRDAACTPAHLAQTVAGAWVGRAVARWGADRCRALCQEVVHDCRWASVAGKELGFAQVHLAPQPQGVRKQVVCREPQGVLLEEQHQLPDAWPQVGPQEHRASLDAQEWALGPQQEMPEWPQGPMALLPLEKLASLQVLRVLLDALRERRDWARHWVRLKLF